MAHDVFISHSSQDKTIADAVCAALENETVRTWIAPRDVQPGRSFAGEITRAIQHSKVMVLIFSKHSNASEQVLREVQLAANSRLHIVQFRIEEVMPNDDLEYYLSAPHWLDALSPPLERHLDRLQASVKALLRLSVEEAPQQITKPDAPFPTPAASEEKTAPVVGVESAAPPPPVLPAPPQPTISPVATIRETQTKQSPVKAKHVGWGWVAAGAIALLFVIAIVYPHAARNPSPQTARTTPTPALVQTASPARTTTPAPSDSSTPSPSVSISSVGDLWVKTIPAGAWVTADDAMMETSPATFSGLPAGRHHLRIVLNGFETQEKDVEVMGGQVAMPEAIILVPKPVKTDQFDGVWVMRPGKKSDWSSTLTINGTTASMTLEWSQDLPRKSSGWEHFPAPYDKSTLFYQWSAEATSVQVTSPTTIDFLWSEWKFTWEPHGLPYAILMRNYHRPSRMPERSFDLVIPPPKDWGFVLKGSDLVSGEYIYHRRR
jgi:hypothetical protein